MKYHEVVKIVRKLLRFHPDLIDAENGCARVLSVRPDCRSLLSLIAGSFYDLADHNFDPGKPVDTSGATIEIGVLRDPVHQYRSAGILDLPNYYGGVPARIRIVMHPNVYGDNALKRFAVAKELFGCTFSPHNVDPEKILKQVRGLIYGKVDFENMPGEAVSEAMAFEYMMPWGLRKKGFEIAEAANIAQGFKIPEAKVVQFIKYEWNKKSEEANTAIDEEEAAITMLGRGRGGVES